MARLVFSQSDSDKHTLKRVVFAEEKSAFFAHHAELERVKNIRAASSLGLVVQIVSGLISSSSRTVHNSTPILAEISI